MAVITSFDFGEWIIYDSVYYGYFHSDDLSVKVVYHATDDVALIAEMLSEKIDIPVEDLKRFLPNYGVDNNSPAALADKLPGVYLKTKHPVTEVETSVRDIIISLNDIHGWKPNQVADWLESTFDTDDIAFGDEVIQVEKGVLSEVARVVKIERILPC